MLLNVLGGIIILWLIFLTFLVVKTLSHYNKLIKGVEKRKLSDVLEELLKNQKENSLKIEQIIKRSGQIEKDSIPHIQKIGLVRFNPFNDTGGNQSFVLAILDGNNDGLVISSLHSRLETHWYAKKIKNGKSEEHELSGEENKAINQAIENHYKRKQRQ